MATSVYNTAKSPLAHPFKRAETNPLFQAVFKFSLSCAETHSSVDFDTPKIKACPTTNLPSPGGKGQRGGGNPEIAASAAMPSPSPRPSSLKGEGVARRVITGNFMRTPLFQRGPSRPSVGGKVPSGRCFAGDKRQDRCLDQRTGCCDTVGARASSPLASSRCLGRPCHRTWEWDDVGSGGALSASPSGSENWVSKWRDIWLDPVCASPWIKDRDRTW
jgi:hypothetical protein